MPRKKYPHEYTDARGNTIVQFEDGRSEMYIGGKDSADNWQDVSNEADAAVKRKRFLPARPAPVAVDLQTRESLEVDDALPGNDDLDDNAD